MRCARALAAVLAAAGCWSSDGEGAVTFTTFGEDYIEREIPARDFADGWSVRYDRFLVVVGEVSIAEEGAAPAASMPGSKVFDMTRPGKKAVVSFAGLPARAYTRVSYAIGPATSSTEVGEGATDADRQLMVSRGYSVYFEGTATRGATAKRMAWGFRTSTLNDRCKTVQSGRETEGVVVTSGGARSVELTIHGDHFFYDDLQGEDAKLRFERLASADLDGDGTLTLDELSGVKLAALPSDAGPYGTGSAAGIHDLRAFVEALSRSLGHFGGEGECIARPR